MKSLFLSIIIMFCAIFTKAQQAPIALHNGSKVSFFYTLNDAYKAASNGDIIYLPSGNFRMDQKLEKQLAIFGVGWRALDSSKAVGGNTLISTSFEIGSKGSNSILSGIYFAGNLGFPDSVRSLNVERSYIQNIEHTGNGAFSNINVNECLIIRAHIPHLGTTKFSNSIVWAQIRGESSGGIEYGIVEFRNSIMLNHSGEYAFQNLNKVDMSNSIVLTNTINTNYRLCSDAYVFATNSLFIGSEYRINVDFIAGAGNSREEQMFRDKLFLIGDGAGFTEAADYHTKPECNCYDKGVYGNGGQFRAIPPVHIAFKEVQSSTNNNTLKFTFRVKTDK